MVTKSWRTTLAAFGIRLAVMGDGRSSGRTDSTSQSWLPISQPSLSPSRNGGSVHDVERPERTRRPLNSQVDRLEPIENPAPTGDALGETGKSTQSVVGPRCLRRAQ